MSLEWDGSKKLSDIQEMVSIQTEDEGTMIIYDNKFFNMPDSKGIKIRFSDCTDDGESHFEMNIKNKDELVAFSKFLNTATKIVKKKIKNKK
jgi:hypothetical protein